MRRVPADWEHPKTPSGKYIPLLNGFAEESRTWDERCKNWEAGVFPAHASEKSKMVTYVEWAGERPRAEEYMPGWSDEDATHYMMYETTTEGTPKSPAFSTPEELAQWLYENNVGAYGKQTASYEAWLNIAKGEWSCTCVCNETGIISGVEASL